MIATSRVSDQSAIAIQPPAADADMQLVLDALAALKPQPIESLTPAQARQQPSPADAVTSVLIRRAFEDAAHPRVTIQEAAYPSGKGSLRARIYRPARVNGHLPIVVYFRGGGWVIASLDTYESTPVSLSSQLGAVVISVDYRMGPEHKFPAAHDDAVAAYMWVLANAASWGADVRRIAVAGESAGGNLAAHVSISARDLALPLPSHQVLVYPVAGTSPDTASYRDCADAKPLNAAMMAWFVAQATNGGSDLSDPRLDLIAADLRGLPPTTIIGAEIDPLRSEGEMLAERLSAAGVPVEHRLYSGVTHEFFGTFAFLSG
jgi:acetyl esterase/lipase